MHAQPKSWLVLSPLIYFLVLQPKATLKFPLGEVSLEEKEEEETKRVLSINGIVKGQILNGLCTAQYADEDLKLRYSYKVILWFFFLGVFQLHKMDDWVRAPTKIFTISNSLKF